MVSVHTHQLNNINDMNLDRNEIIITGADIIIMVIGKRILSCIQLANHYGIKSCFRHEIKHQYYSNCIKNKQHQGVFYFISNQIQFPWRINETNFFR